MKQNAMYDSIFKPNTPFVPKDKDRRNIFLDLEHCLGIVSIITPETTCEDILKKHSNELSYYLSNRHIEYGYIFSIIDSNNIYTIIKLQLTSHPYNYLKEINCYLYYLPKCAYVFNNTTQRPPNMDLNYIKPTNKNDIKITDKGIYKYNPIKNHFKRKPALLTESCFSITKTHTQVIIPINSIIELNNYLKYSSTEIKNRLKETTHLIEIKLKDTIYIFRARTTNKYDHWLNCFKLALSLIKDEKRDQIYNNELELNSTSIGRNSILKLQETLDLRYLLNKTEIRKYLLTTFNNKKYHDLIEYILSYKTKVINKDYRKAWDLFSLIFKSIMSTSNHGNNNNFQTKQLNYISVNNINSLKSLREKIQNIIDRTKPFSAFDQPTQIKLNELMKVDCFHEIYEEIIDNILIPFFDKHIPKSMINNIYSSTLSFEFMKRYNFSLDKMDLLNK